MSTPAIPRALVSPAVALVATALLSAQQPQLLVDANAAPPANRSSLPNGGVEFKGYTYFSASTIGQDREETGIELFRTLGITGTSQLFLDIWPGHLGSAPQGFQVAGSYLFFSARRNFSECLFRTDGTLAGTLCLAEVSVGARVEFQGKLYFFVGTDFWVSDGSIQGTQRLVAFPRVGIFFPVTHELVVFGNKLLLTGASTAQGQELWVSDGTTAGTALLADLDPGAGSSGPNTFRVAGSRVFFVASTAATGRELWVTDGTPAGTQLVKDVLPGPTSSMQGLLPDRSSAPLALQPLGGRLLFSAQDGNSGAELWSSDGTPQGTMLLKDLNTGSSFDGHSAPQSMVSDGSVVYFVAFETTSAWSLWKTDGTAAGTVQLGPGGVAPTHLFLDGSRLYFRSFTTSAGYEPWTSDGTSSGTRMIHDIVPGPTSSNPSSFFKALTGRVLFSADDGKIGAELWETDATAQNTKIVDDIHRPLPGSSDSGAAFSLTTSVGRTYFSAFDGQDPALWSTDGTAAGTRMIRKVNVGGGDYQWMASHNTSLFFNAGDAANGTELWLSDGTSAGTRLLRDIAPGAGNSYPREFTAAGKLMFFSADDLVHGRELWASDGSTAGTRLVRDIRASGDSNPAEMVALGNVLLFAAYDDVAGGELWRSDGTEAGTFLVKDLRPGNMQNSTRDPWSSQPHAFCVVGRHAYFIANDLPNGQVGYQLFRTDGTSAGTVKLADGRFAQTAVVGDTLFVTDERVLYAVDTLAATPQLVTVRDVGNGRNPYMDALTPAGDRLFFVALASTTSSASVLWVSDGTSAGTVPVVDAQARQVEPVAVAFARNPLLVGAGSRRVFFTANPDDRNEPELWVSDGTAGGTRQVYDLRPGPYGSHPVFLVHAHGKLLFGADDGLIGREVWAVDIGGSKQVVGGGCGASFAPILDCADPVLGARFAIELRRAEPNRNMVFALGLPAAAPFTIGGCVLALDYGLGHLLTFAQTSATGRWQTSLQVADNVNRIGLRLAIHAGVDSPGHPPFGMDFSNTVYLVLGR
ncbi:MAG: hypothetical protein H6837_17870 [Planctomycetes bacterium]|nr:hypothetical protein [Planctomycetota bacterium]